MVKKNDRYRNNTSTLRRVCFMLVAPVLFLSSCGPGEFTPITQVDARILTFVTPEDTLFGIGLYAYTNGEFNHVTAFYNDEDGAFYTLEPFNNAKNDFSYETPLEEMTQTPPPAGEYVFDVEFQDQEFFSLTDLLTSDYVLPPIITRCEYNTTIDQIVISWAEIMEEGILRFTVYNTDRELLYASSAIDKSQVIYTLAYNSQTWFSKNPPEPGEELIIGITFYLFEVFTYGAMDTQSSGRIEKKITWGG
jgi:hypothetical protein